MSTTPVLAEATEVTIEDIIAALKRVPLERLPDILQFIEFIQYQAADDASEDEALWAAVEANQEYKRQHPDEELERYRSGAEFLEATAEL